MRETLVMDASNKVTASYDLYYASKGWFSCNTQCYDNYNAYLESQQQLRTAEVRFSVCGVSCASLLSLIK